jgi:hypothetical protein
MAYLGRQPNTGVRSRYIYTATASQTTFSGSDDDGKTLKYEDAAYLDVFLNGVLLKPVTDYTATSKTSVVLTSGAAVSDIVEIVAYDIANIADAVSKANGGTFDAGVTVNGDLTVNSNATVTGAFTSQGIDDNATSTALTLDSSGKLLVGTTSSNEDGAFVATSSGGEVGFSFRNNATATDTASALYLQSWTNDGTQAGVSKISSTKDSSTYGTNLAFYTTTGSAGNTTEALRIDSNQNLGIGTAATTDQFRVKVEPASVDGSGTDPSAALYVRCSTSSGHNSRSAMRVAVHGYYTQYYGHNGIVVQNADSNTSRTSIDMQMLGSTGATVGSIRHNNNGTSFNTTSDYRLKENVVDLDGAIERLNQLQPRRFNFISDENDTVVDGFLAHEVSDVIPEAVHGTKDQVETDENGVARLDSDGNQIPQYQQIDQAKIVPLLTAALQEAITKIEALEARVATLENA